MADLGSQKISSNYKKLLQRDENGFVADGSGSLVSLNISGSEYYTSGSDQVLKAVTVTGSILPEGSATWDLGSNDHPFQHIFVSENSIVFVDPNEPDPVKKLKKGEMGPPNPDGSQNETFIDTSIKKGGDIEFK